MRISACYLGAVCGTSLVVLSRCFEVRGDLIVLSSEAPQMSAKTG
jgi:hypothetical protein